LHEEEGAVMNHVLVTGGSGYFGSALVRWLKERGLKVAVFDVEDNHDRPDDVIFFNGDIRDSQTVKIACQGMDSVYHCAASALVPNHAAELWSINYDGASNLLQSCQEARVRKVIYISSSAIFGAAQKNPITDSTRPRPQDDFGRAKLAAEELCHEYVSKGMDITIIRPRTIMGRCRLGFMQLIFELVRQGKNIPIPGEGDNLLQFLHAEDLARACLKAANRKGPSVYNVGAEKFCTLRQTLEGLIAHAGTESRLMPLPLKPVSAIMKLMNRLGWHPGGLNHALLYGQPAYFDISRIKKELHWYPKYGNVAMICESYDWYLKNREQMLRTRPGAYPLSSEDQGVLNFLAWFLEIA
jgi:nucleoside-diphosphate-sugar epimerase